jgi:hypothetical protein
MMSATSASIELLASVMTSAKSNNPVYLISSLLQAPRQIVVVADVSINGGGDGE